MRRQIFLAVYAAMIMACATTPPRSECTIAPPKDYEGNKEAAAKVGADLTALASAPVKGNVEASFKTKVKETFQTIPERDVACQMLLQTVSCLSRQRGNQDAISNLLSYIREDDKCGAASAKKKADGYVMETLKDLIHLEAGQAPVHFLMAFYCRKDEAPPAEQLTHIATAVLAEVRDLRKLTATAPASDIVVAEFGSFRQLALDLAAREEILTYLTSENAKLDRERVCNLASQYEDLHRRLAILEAAYYRYLQSTPRFTRASAGGADKQRK